MKRNKIFVNQIGYKTNSLKQAFLAVEECDSKDLEKENQFFVVNDKGEKVYTGNIQTPKSDRLAGEKISCLDFSNFTQPGKYSIKLDSDDCASYPFEISDNVYDSVFESTIHYFYLSRCSVEISSKTDGGKWNHPACHTSVAEIYGEPGKTKLVTGGWHDAGDYGRYVIAVTKTAMDLMLTLEQVLTGIPSSVSKETLYDEIRFGLDWLLQMQAESGAVYHKISCYHFCGFIMPQDEKDKQVIAPVSTAATADFAGCLAYAYLLFKEVDKPFADTLLAAAIKAQNYLDCHEDEIYQNPPEISTGNYGDPNVKDERFFGLCGLYAATNNKEYLEKAMAIRQSVLDLPEDKENPWKNKWFIAFGWGSVAGYGNEILLKKADLPEDVRSLLKKEIIDRADKAVEMSEAASFGTSFGKVFWGSNGHVCDEAHILLLAYDLEKNEKYFETARKQLNYIFGCNPLDICYISCFGKKSPQRLHHRPSGFMKSPMPGMIAGGPCEGLADKLAKEKLVGKPPLQCYLDEEGSYSTNEIDIYWNSPLVYLISKMM